MSLPSGVVTFGFTDIEGSTRLFAALGEAYRAVLARHNEIVREALARHGGVEIRTEGDSFFVAFSSARSAIAFAADAQRAFGTVEWPTGTEIRVRIGLHTGEAVPEGDDYISLVVHHAARVATAAHGGQTLVSRATVDAAGDVGSDLSLRSLGRHRLRDVEDAVELFELGGDGLPPGPGRTRAVPASAHGLSVPATPLLGREAELERLVAMLRRERLVTVLGAGGTGKTRLAVAVAAEVAPEVEGDAWIVMLAELPTGAPARAVASAVADVLGAPPAEQPLDAVAAAVGQRKLLLVLDNCEHVVDGAAEVVAALLVRCPGMRVLATSRETLRTAGETVLRLGPLPLPGEGARGAALLVRSPAVRLFLDRARAASADVVADEATVAAASAVARAVEGLPLAIELAAARCASLSPGQVAERIGDALALLKGGARTAAPRQRALRATLEWSHELLGPDERVVFRRLAVLPASFPLEVAELTAGFGELTTSDVLDHVHALVEQSLLEADGGRFRFLVPVRAFALEALRDAGEEEAAIEALTSGLWSRFEAATAHGRTMGQHSDRRALLDELVETVGEPTLVSLVARGAAAEDDRVALLARGAIPRLWELGRLRAARALVDAALPLHPPPRVRALLRFDAVLLSGYDGIGTDDVDRLIEEGLAAASEAGDEEPMLRGALLHALADHVVESDLERGLTLYQEARDLAEQAGLVRERAIRTRAIVRRQVFAGLPVDAAGVLQRDVIPALESVGDDFELARTKSFIADVADAEHRGRAVAAWEEAAAAARDSTPADLPFVLIELAGAYLLAGRPRDAEAPAREAVRLQLDRGAPAELLQSLARLVDAVAGDVSAARELVPIAREAGFFYPVGILADAGYVAEARELWDAAGRLDAPSSPSVLARLRLAEGDVDGALAALSSAAPPAQPLPVAIHAAVEARARLRSSGAEGSAARAAANALGRLVDVEEWPMAAHLLVDVADSLLAPAQREDIRRTAARWLRGTGQEAYLHAWGLDDVVTPPSGESWEDATASLRAAATALVEGAGLWRGQLTESDS